MASRPTSSRSRPNTVCTNAKVRQLLRRIEQHYDGEVASSGIRTTQYSLLSNVSRAGPLRCCDLALQLKMTPSTLSRNLKPLVSAGLLRMDAAGDARSRLVALTPEGSAKLAEARQCWQVAQASLAARLGKERVEALHALIDESLALLEAQQPAPSRRQAAARTG